MLSLIFVSQDGDIKPLLMLNVPHSVDTQTLKYLFLLQKVISWLFLVAASLSLNEFLLICTLSSSRG